MKKQVLLKLIFITVLAVFASIVKSQQALPFKGIDEYIKNGMKEWQIPGLSLAIIKDGKIIYAKGYGVCEIGKENKVDENTIFAVASNSKAFTGLALCILANENKISLDDKVKKYIPDYQLYDTTASREVTIRDLLCHRIGLGTFHGDLVVWGSNYSRDEVIHKMKYIKPSFSFRNGFGYCNTAFITAGEIIPRVTGKSWDDFIKERILIPLEMKRTTTSINDFKNLKNIATPHTILNGKVITIPYRNTDNIGPAASLNSTATDLAHWLILQMDTSGKYNNKFIISHKIIKQTQRPQNILPSDPYFSKIFPQTHLRAYCLGWSMQDYYGKAMYRHTGSADGMVSITGFLPEEKLGIVILTNYDQHDFNVALFYQIIDAYLGVQYKDWNKYYKKTDDENKAKQLKEDARLDSLKKLNVVPDLKINEYSGNYENKHYGAAKITIENDILYLMLLSHNGLKGKLDCIGKDLFLCTWNDPIFGRSTIPFTIKDNKVINFKVKINPDFIDPVEYSFEKE
ncbi:MAG: serine hydrolase [Bacteroidales bacterium]|nr:serine hydrolase [Bacteroidales bacterium]